MNGTFGNYLMQLGGYGQQNPNATPTKRMNEWGMEDYFQALNNRGQSGAAGTGVDGTSNLGKAIGSAMGIQTAGGLGGTVAKRQRMRCARSRLSFTLQSRSTSPP